MIDRRNGAGHNRAVSRCFTLARCPFGNPVAGPRARSIGERLASPTPDDNRVTHGCINVSPAFYEQVVSPTFARGGVFYVLPDEGSLEEAFPEFAGAGTRKTAGD